MSQLKSLCIKFHKILLKSIEIQLQQNQDIVPCTISYAQQIC